MMVGTHPDTGELFAISNNDAVGWGATATHDGGGPRNHPCQTVARNTPIEVMEARSGMRFERLEILADSGGAGRFRGGCGVRRDIVFTCDGEFLSVIKKTKSPPWALAGGRPPAPNTVIAFPGTDRERAISTERIAVRTGDRIRLLTAGGGGHGDPARRDHDAIRHDLDRGLHHPHAARATYAYDDTQRRREVRPVNRPDRRRPHRLHGRRRHRRRADRARRRADQRRTHRRRRRRGRRCSPRAARRRRRRRRPRRAPSSRPG